MAGIPEWMVGEVSEYDLEMAIPPSTILDIGACIGAYTLRCAHRWPHARIIAYEPMRESAELFRQHCGALGNVELHQMAIRSFTGGGTIGACKNRVRCGFRQLGDQFFEYRMTDCLAASELPAADLIKIDTEGCEVEILGAMNLSKAKAIVCEFHMEQDRPKIIEICQRQGLKLISEKMESKDNGVLKFQREANQEKRKVKLFVGLPIYAQVPCQFVQCLLALQANRPCEIEMHMCQGDGVARSRNQLTAAFLKSDCTDLLFMDCDLLFGPDHVERMISHDADIVGGFYPKKQQGALEWVINGFGEPTLKRDDGLQKVAYIGTGFMRIRRHVFERMIAEIPGLEFDADYGKRQKEHDLWPMGVYTYPSGHRRYLSEDWYFCQRWMDLGGEIFGDTKVILKHIGPCIFPLDTQIPEITHPREAASPEQSDRAFPEIPATA